MRALTLLGSTGSIGENTLQVVSRLRRAGWPLKVWGLSAQKNVKTLLRQVETWRPAMVSVEEPAAARALQTVARRRRWRLKVEVGASGLVKLAEAPASRFVLSAVVGVAGLPPLWAAVQRGKTIAVANKEALVAGGPWLAEEAQRRGAVLVPVDSEHSAMFQCLAGNSEGPRAVRRLVLTASGGAFYRRRGSLSRVTVAEALQHPTWRMGQKITVDCATLVNKGLEAMEARVLFGVPMEAIDIVVHPASIVHSLVEFIDGSVLAQLSVPDMQLPIQLALTWPRRGPQSVGRLDLTALPPLVFKKPSFQRFPGLGLALEAGRRGGLWPAVFSAANEQAVGAFLARRLPFTGIPEAARATLKAFQKAQRHTPRHIDDILAADGWARGWTDQWLQRRSG